MKLTLEKIHLSLGAIEFSFDTMLEGQLIGVFGPSGAGKTTLLEIIAGLRRIRSGRITLNQHILCDQNLGIWTAPRYRHIGYVPQDLALFPNLNVQANLTYGMTDPSDEQKLQSVASVLELTSLLDRFPNRLSGGEKQRVAFARAILAEPTLLLLDEPLASLDQSLKERIFPYLIRIRDEMKIPMMYVTHSASEIVRLCDYLLILENGHLIARGTPSSLLEPILETHYQLRSSLPLSKDSSIL